MMTSCAPIPFMRSNIPSPMRSRPPSTCSAGNLLGTTRMSQPGPFGGPPFWRYDRISGGVSASCPAQNGQCSRPMMRARSKTKSFGRFWRSVAMITHRPVMGSLRSSGIECVLKNLHHGPSAVELNRHHVEPAGTLGDVLAHDVVGGQPRHAQLLQPRDRLGRVAEPVAVARLHFHEYQRRAVARDDVDFSTAPAVPPGKYCVPAPFELATREIFASFSEVRAR